MGRDKVAEIEAEMEAKGKLARPAPEAVAFMRAVGCDGVPDPEILH